MKPPNPTRVSNHYDYWVDPPPEPSVRLTFWMSRIDSGWRPNRRLCSMGYDCSAEWYGVYIWEYLNVIVPKLKQLGSK